MNVLTGDTVLAPRDDLTVEVFDDGAVVWDPKEQRLHHLDGSAAATWSRLDGARPLAEVFSAVAESFGVTPDVVRRDSMPFVADLVARGLVVAPG